jgi:hypothetical protein
MTSDEYKALRLRRAQLRAELARVEVLLGTEPPTTRVNDLPEPIRQPPIGDDWAKIRKDFYRDAENDFRNTDSNGNYVNPEDC